MIKTARVRWGFILKFFIVLLLCIWAVLGQNNITGFSVPILITLGLAAWWVLSRGKTSRILVPVCVWWLTLLISSLLSIEPHRSLYWLAVVSAGLLIIFLTAGISRSANLSELIIGALLIAGGIFITSVYSDAIQWYGSWLEVFPGEWLPWLSYRHPSSNPGGAYITGCTILAASLMLKSKSRIARTGLGIYSLMGIVAVFLVSSRGALVGLFTAALVWAVIERDTWLHWLQPVIHYLKPRKSILVLTVTVLGAGIIAAGWLVINAMASHPTHGGGLVLNSRSIYWNTGWKSFLQSPLWGNGLFTYAAFFMQSLSIPPSVLFIHAHNIYIDMLSSAGIPGLLAFGWMVIAVFQALFRARRVAPAKDQGVVLGGILMLAGILGHGFFDEFINMPAASTNLMLALGAALVYDPPEERSVHHWTFTAFGVCTCLLVWVTAFTRVPVFQASTAITNDNPREASQLIEKAVGLVPYSPYYHSQAGIVSASLASKENGVMLETATQHFEQAVKLDPYYAVHHLNLGALYFENSELEKALSEFEEAARIAPAWDLAALHTGLAYEALGENDRSLRAYWRALELNPVAADDAFWKTTETRQTALQLFRISTPATEKQEELDIEATIRQSYAGPILELAEERLISDDLEHAKQFLDAAELSYFESGLERMEYKWLRAKVAAIEGNYVEAGKLGTEAVHGLIMQGSQGPGTAGWSIYGPGIYWIPEVKGEFVDQVVQFRTFGAWPERMAELATWLAKAGDSTGSEETLNLLSEWQK